MKEFLSKVNLESQMGKMRANDKIWVCDPFGNWSLDITRAKPSSALDDMVNKSNRKLYKFDCLNSVYFAQLYAIKEIFLKESGTNDSFNNCAIINTMTFRADHQRSPLLKLITKLSSNDFDVGARICFTVEGISENASGSRVKLTQLLPSNSVWKNENVLVLTTEKLYAWGISTTNGLSLDGIINGYSINLVNEICKTYKKITMVYVEENGIIKTTFFDLSKDEGKVSLRKHISKHNIRAVEISKPTIDYCTKNREKKSSGPEADAYRAENGTQKAEKIFSP
ncbi:MAG: hypothetical protein JRD93_12050 [Deltaproteobacteria bacterium]|nr:hypothetical protein [Deltaproteobacteria bacterium]